MNNPYLWFNPRSVPTSLLGTYDDDTSPDRFLFTDARPVELSSNRPSFHFPASSKRLARLGILPNNIRVPLISAQVASLLQTICHDDFQLLPATIQTLDSVITDYFLLNVIAEISGIDHTGSRFIMMPGHNEILKIEQLQYRIGSMNGHHLAREREYQPFLWASDTIVREFTRANFKGCAFEPPESIHP